MSKKSEEFFLVACASILSIGFLAYIAFKLASCKNEPTWQEKIEQQQGGSKTR